MLANAEALAAITNPTVNTYKRINAPLTLSGATWSPNTITYTGNNRTHMIRIPEAGPLRAAPAGRRRQSLSAAGGDSGGGAGRHRRQERDPGKRLDINMYTDGHTGEGRQEAAAQSAGCAARLRGLQAVPDAFGDEFISAYVKLKTQSWNDYMRHLTKWELETTLDC